LILLEHTRKGLTSSYDSTAEYILIQGSNQLETVQEFMIAKTNAEICTVCYKPKVEIKICTAMNMDTDIVELKIK